MIPRAKIDEWEALARAATEGPWYAGACMHSDGTEQSVEISLGGNTLRALMSIKEPHPPGRAGFLRACRNPDIAFAAASRQAVPELVAALRETVRLLGKDHRWMIHATLEEHECEVCAMLRAYERGSP